MTQTTPARFHYRLIDSTDAGLLRRFAAAPDSHQGVEIEMAFHTELSEWTEADPAIAAGFGLGRVRTLTSLRHDPSADLGFWFYFAGSGTRFPGAERSHHRVTVRTAFAGPDPIARANWRAGGQHGLVVTQIIAV